MPLAPDDPRHGTRNGYGNLGCRCEPCRVAAKLAMREAKIRYPKIAYNAARRHRLQSERPNKIRAWKFVDPGYKNNDWLKAKHHLLRAGGPWLLFLAILSGRERSRYGSIRGGS